LRENGQIVTFTLELPDDIARIISGRGDLSRRALESLLFEEYRSGGLTKSDLRRVLALSYDELEGFLKAHGELNDFSPEEFERQREAIRRAGF
jgi:hypothetical protein